MSGDDIHIDDLWRILVGEVPGSFFIEAILRTFFIYIILMGSMRMMGKRMTGQLNRVEMISLTTLAAAIGVPIQAPDRGLLPPLIIVIVVVLSGRVLSILSFKSANVEKALQDELTTLVKDSVLQLKALEKVKITRERLFAFLRSNNVVHLGGVKRVYLEAGGFFTLVQNDKDEDPRAGLIIIPSWDKEFIEELRQSDVVVCNVCGTKRKDISTVHCPNCHKAEWIAGSNVKYKKEE